MTQEEKAKAYDEALELAKEKREIAARNGAEITVKFLEEIFPELRESEDERIRKVIYKLLLGMRNEIFTSQDEIVTKDKALAYLEKQKEQKPADLPPGFYFIDLDGKKYYSKEFRYGDMKMKIVEDKSGKPAEWSEEDEKMIELIRAIVFGTGKVSNGVRTEIWDWLKSLRPSWKPSKNEERLINTSISFLKDFADKGYENAVECIDWLKSKLNGNSCK